MAFRFKQAQSVQKNLRRIATEQVQRAIEEIEDSSLDRHVVVHQVRKRCKKLRGLIRLVQPCFRGYGRENKFFRDSARPLSQLRDRQSLIEAFDKLQRVDRRAADRCFSPIREVLVEQRRSVAVDAKKLEQGLADFYGRMQKVRQRIPCWKLDATGFRAIEGGLTKTYGRARHSLQAALEKPSAEAMHEWRKQVKYHAYQTRLLRPIWSPLLKVRGSTAADLAETLGDYHDLCLLQRACADSIPAILLATDRQAWIEAIVRRREVLVAAAAPAGRRLFAEKPRQIEARWKLYWRVWRSDS